MKCLLVAFFIFGPNLGLLVKPVNRNHIFRGVFGTYCVEDPFCTVIGIGHIL